MTLEQAIENFEASKKYVPSAAWDREDPGYDPVDDAYDELVSAFWIEANGETRRTFDACDPQWEDLPVSLVEDIVKDLEDMVFLDPRLTLWSFTGKEVRLRWFNRRAPGSHTTPTRALAQLQEVSSGDVLPNVLSMGVHKDLAIEQGYLVRADVWL